MPFQMTEGKASIGAACRFQQILSLCDSLLPLTRLAQRVLSELTGCARNDACLEMLSY